MSKKILVITVLTFLLFMQFVSCERTTIPAKLEKIATVATWASPYWGYHTPKIVRNAAGEMWSISMAGSYPESNMQIHKKTPGGEWTAGHVFKNHYQPGMLLLDAEGRLNVILNNQESPIEQWRSTDNTNLNNFELIARGNGLPDGRGWYVGVAIRDDLMYLSYVTLDYVSYLSMKTVLDSVWSPARVMHSGYPHELGNHSLLYSGFEFGDSTVYACGSFSRDGSVHNTYEEIILKYFPIGHPEQLLSETIFKGDSGYYSFGYDMLIDTRTEEIYVALSAGIHSYGPAVENSVDPGLYVSVGKAGEGNWTLNKVAEGSGSIALHLDETENALYAYLCTGGWFDQNVLTVKKSLDKGKSWSDVSELSIPPGADSLVHPYFIQSISPKSGSVYHDPVFVFSEMHNQKNADSLFIFDLFCLEP